MAGCILDTRLNTWQACWCTARLGPCSLVWLRRRTGSSSSGGSGSAGCRWRGGTLLLGLGYVCGAVLGQLLFHTAALRCVRSTPWRRWQRCLCCMCPWGVGAIWLRLWPVSHAGDQAHGVVVPCTWVRAAGRGWAGPASSSSLFSGSSRSFLNYTAACDAHHGWPLCVRYDYRNVYRMVWGECIR